MKYAKVAMRSTATMATAPSHHRRRGSRSRHAAIALASVSRVRGTVVT
ncbi:MAG: hypothetical protein ACREKJ_01885 [Candidatus Rokuibacteriota bacterium]